MHLLEVPGVFAGERHRHDRGREQVVAGAVATHAARFRAGIAGREIDEPEIRVDRRRLPDCGAAHLPGVRPLGIGVVRLWPGVGAKLARRWHGPEPPPLLAGPGIERKYEA